MSRASQAKRPRPTQKEKKFERKNEIYKSRTRKAKKTNWKGGRFVEFVEGRCQEHGVELAEITAAGARAPKALRGQMDKALRVYHEVGIDNDKLADILEWLVAHWHDGLSERIGRGKPFSVFTILYKARQIIEAYQEGTSRPSQTGQPQEDQIQRAKDAFDALPAVDDKEE
jgi:hypothetical protein